MKSKAHFHKHYSVLGYLFSDKAIRSVLSPVFRGKFLAGVWNTGTYDPDLNLTYWGTGNPVPPADEGASSGDQLYSDSVVALDADTGAYRWHYQFTPGDNHDWDAAHVPVLIDLEWQGLQRKVLLTATKNGVMYVLDRRTGEFLTGKPFVELNWMSGFDERGRPVPTSLPPDVSVTTGRHELVSTFL